MSTATDTAQTAGYIDLGVESESWAQTDPRRIPAPVFGPNRPAAARAAITELAAAQAYRADNPWSDRAARRLRAAKLNRDQYTEYGDTFTSH